MRTGVVVAAHRTVGRFRVHRTRSRGTQAGFGDVTCTRCWATNRSCGLELACGRAAIAVGRIAIVAGFRAIDGAIATHRVHCAHVRNLRRERLVGQTRKGQVVNEPTAGPNGSVRPDAEPNTNRLVRQRRTEVDRAIHHGPRRETPGGPDVRLTARNRVVAGRGNRPRVSGCAQRTDVVPRHAPIFRVFDDAAVPILSTRLLELVAVLERHRDAAIADDEIRRFVPVIARAANVLTPRHFIDADRGQGWAIDGPKGRGDTCGGLGRPRLRPFPRFRGHTIDGIRNGYVVMDFPASRRIHRRRTRARCVDHDRERNVRRRRDARAEGHGNGGAARRQGCRRRHHGAISAGELHVRIRRRDGHGRARERSPAIVLNVDRNDAAFAHVENAITVARRRGIGDRDGAEGRIGSVGRKVFHDARERRRCPRRRYGTGANAAGGESGHEVLQIRCITTGQRRGENAVPLLGEQGIDGNRFQPTHDVVCHFAFGLVERMAGGGAGRIFEQIRICLPQHRGPDLAGVVHFRIRNTAESRRGAWRQSLPVADVLERQAILGKRRRIRITTNAVISAVAEGRCRIHARRKRTAEIVRTVVGVDELYHGHEVAPAFAHGAHLLVTARSQTEMEVMAPFMPHDPVVNGSIPVDRATRLRRTEHVHLHDRRSTIRRRLHIRVVRAAVVLGFRADRIAAETTTTIVVRLGIARRFVEPRIVPIIVVVVVIDEELRNGRSTLVRPRGLLGRIVRPIENASRGRRGAEIRTRQSIRRGKIRVRIDVVAIRRRRARRQPRIEGAPRIRIETIDRHEVRRNERRR